MEKEIIEIVKSLLSGNLTFIGLIFTSLGIIFSIKDNWKTKTLRKSEEFNNFLSLNVWCVILTILLCILSCLIIIFQNYYLTFWILFVAYMLFILILFYFIIKIILRYRSLILLLNDDKKPELSIQADKNDE